MAVGGGDCSSPPAEPEALKHAFSYLVNSIDTAALLPAALSRGLITERQRTECSTETDPYKKAEVFLGYLQRAVNADYGNYFTFVQILKETHHAKIASRLRDELTYSIRSIQQPSASSSIDEEHVIVPEALVEELADLRFAFAKLLRNYEKQLRNSPEAQEEFVAFLPHLFHKEFRVEDHSCFQSHFKTLIEKEVSLFNTHYLKRICDIFPDNVRATTRQLVEEYEQQRKCFMKSATVSQFKLLFPATATPSRLSLDKVPVKLKLKNDWGSDTIEDLTKLVINFGVSGNAFHLSKVEDGCIAVVWLCSTTEVKQLKMAILEATGCLLTKGVLQVFIGEEELVLEYSPTDVTSILPSDLPQSRGVHLAQSELTAPSSLMPATDNFTHKPVTIHLVQETDIDYQCPVCFEPLTEPYHSIKCGHHLCRQCRDNLLSIKKTECPTCRKPDELMSAVPDVNLQRKVKNLKVRCSEYKEGCDWVGELRDLHDHLDPTKKQCDIIAFPFTCPFCNDKYSCKTEMKEHTHHCHKRMISCKNCGYYNTFTVVTKNHYRICPRSHPALRSTTESQYHYLLNNQQPMEFTISDLIEKKEEWYSPLFYTHYRGYKFCIEVIPSGYSIGSGSHVSIYAYLLRGEYDEELAWPFEGDIRVELLNWKEDSNHHSDTIHYNRYHDRDSTHSSRVTDRVAANGLGIPQFISHADLVSTSSTNYLRNDFLRLRVNVIIYSTPLPYRTPEHFSLYHSILKSGFTSTQSGGLFIISEYSRRKQLNNEYFSPPFFISQGYTFCLRVFANGSGSGKDSHLSIFAYIMKGRHDDHLQWPFTGTIVIELLDWLEDKAHYKTTLSIDANSEFARVTEGEYGKNLGYQQFISHRFIGSQYYIKHDCICLRVNDRFTL